MRIPSGVVDQVIFFVAVDATDFVTRETGLSSFTVYRARNTGAATAMTTPTVTELSSANMPGVYKLLLDEDMTIDAGDDSQEMVFHITHAGMAPVTRTIELYRPKVTAGETLGVSGGDVLEVNTLTGHTAQTGDSFARLGAPAGASVSADIAAIEAQTDDIGAAGAGLTAVLDRLPAALVSGRMDASVGAYQTGLAPLQPTTAGRTLDVTATGAAGVDWGNVENPTATVQLSNTEVGFVANGVTVGAFAAGSINAAATSADFIDEINAAVDTALSDIHLDHLLAADYDPASKPGVATALLNELVESDAGVSRFTANALEQAPSGGGGGGDATAANQTTIINHLTDIKGATFNASTDSLEAIRDRGDAAWITATGFATSAALTTLSTAVADLPTNAELATALDVLPTAAENATAVLAAGDVDGYSLEETLKLCLAALAGKLSGAATTSIVIRAADDSKNRITATVDADGNRSAVTLDETG